MALANEDERSASTPGPRPTVTPAAVRPLRTPMALAVADVADEPPRNGRLLPVKRVGAGTAKVRGSIAVDTVFEGKRKISPTIRTRTGLIPDIMMLEREAALKPAR
jgi:hypothetical protein